MKRFWTSVAVADRGVLLDGRPVRTPARAALVLPNDRLAEAVADEWRAVGEEVDPRTMPLTGLANAAIDRPPPPESIAAYGQSDLLCYRAEAPEPLVERQLAVWEPLLDWARSRYDIAFAVTVGVIPVPQPSSTMARLAAAIAGLNRWERTALSPLVSIGGSLVVGLMLVEEALGPDAAFEACHLDESWQAELWGEEWMATEMRAARRADFLNTASFLALLRRN